MAEQLAEAPADERPQLEPAWLTSAEEEAWKTVAALILVLPGRFDAQLQRDSNMTMFEYFVLSNLSMAEGRTLRVSQLAELANGSLSRMSNVMKRLEQRGWIRRESAQCDGRGTNAALTDAGWEQVVAAAPGHVAAVRRHVIDPLTPAQIRSLHTIGQRIMGQTPFGKGCG